MIRKPNARAGRHIGKATQKHKAELRYGFGHRAMWEQPMNEVAVQQLVHLNASKWPSSTVSNPAVDRKSEGPPKLNLLTGLKQNEMVVHIPNDRLPIGDYRGSLLPHTRAVKCGSAKSTVQWEYHPAEWLWCHVFRKKLPRGFVGDWVSTLKSEQPQQGLWGVELKNPTKSPLMSEEVSSRNWWRFPNLLTGGWRFAYFCCNTESKDLDTASSSVLPQPPTWNPSKPPQNLLETWPWKTHHSQVRWNPWQFRSHTVRLREEQRASEGHKTLQRVSLLRGSRAFRLEQGLISAVSNSRTKCFTRAIIWKRCLEVHLQTAWQLVAFSRLLFYNKRMHLDPVGLRPHARSPLRLLTMSRLRENAWIQDNHNTWQCPRITLHIPVRGWTKEIHLQLKHELRETGEKTAEEKFASKMQAPMISTGCPWCERFFPRA